MKSLNPFIIFIRVLTSPPHAALPNFLIAVPCFPNRAARSAILILTCPRIPVLFWHAICNRDFPIAPQKRHFDSNLPANPPREGTRKERIRPPKRCTRKIPAILTDQEDKESGLNKVPINTRLTRRTAD